MLTRASIKLAVIDTGVDLDHPRLVDHIGRSGFDLTGDGDPRPRFAHNNHGTAAVGLAISVIFDAVRLLGVRRNVEILPIKYAYHETPAGDWLIRDGAQAKAIDLAVRAGADVLLCAWHMSASDDTTNAIKRAIRQSCLLVCPAGNHGPLAPNGVRYPATLAASDDPTLRDGVIAVSAVNQFDEFKTHRFDDETTPSSDADVDWGSNRGTEISLAAPGVGLTTTANGGGYMKFSGTSAAAALVGGAAAALLTAHPNATPNDIKTWLQRGADPAGPESPNKFVGHGRLNLAGAMRVARESIEAETCSD
jgi:subtilisin family serine protease